MIRFFPASISALMLATTLVGMTGCAKTTEQPAKADTVVSQAPAKGKNIMRFEDTPKPAASTHAGEL